MAGILTKKFDVSLASDFITDVNTSNNNYYVFVAHSTPWANDSSPPTANLAVSNYDHDVYDNILYGKRITNNDIKQLIPRYNWTNNTLYAEYDKDDSSLFTKQYFVYNPAASIKSVFKVIQAGTGNSVVAPAIISTSPFKTSDGYVWKYMYTVSDPDMNKFGSNNYIPITPNSAVTAAAIPGGIDAVEVLAGGTGWATFNTGTLQSVVNATSVIISSNASSNDDFYVDSSIYFKSGLGSSQIRNITDYFGATKRIVLDPPLDIKVNIGLANVGGTFAVNDILTQNLVALTVSSQSGYIQPGDTITQSNTGATALIVTANNSYLRVRPLTSTEFINNEAIDAGRGTTLGNSTVTTSTSSNTVTAAGNANFTAFYSVGDYIKVGTFFHRVTAIANNTSLTVAGPFGATYAANAHVKVNSAATVLGTSNISASGVIEFADVNGAILFIDTATNSFDLGEIITQSASSTNGVVFFANSSKLIISSISGSGFVANATILGVTSNTTANVVSVASNPTVTLANTTGSFILGARVTSTSSGNAFITTATLLPNEQTEYIISPKVTITGDGSNAAAYALVNTTSKSIESIVVFDPGTNYTEANVTVSANFSYGNGAILKPLIAPLSGHGSNVAFELGSSFVGISTTFGNTYTESFNLPGAGKFRSVGIIRNPLFDNVYVTVSDYDRVKINLNGANTFDVGEVVYQANLATGTVVFSNTSLLELKSVKGSFDKAAANLTVIGLSSEKTSLIANVNINDFTVVSNSFVVQETSEAAGNLVQRIVNGNTVTLRLTNVSGTFQNNLIVFDTASNAYANVTAVNTANNTKPLNFSYFNQLTRATLTQLSGSFNDSEKVEMRTTIGTKIGSALVYDTSNDIDLLISSNTAPFALNERIDQNTSANGILIGANSTHLKLTNVKGTFTASANITGNTSSANANVTSVLKVITLANLDGNLTESTNNFIKGLTSNATGYVENPNTIVRPNLVRDTGSVLYIENISPVTRTDISTETTKLVIKF